MTTELQRLIDGLGRRLQRNITVDDWRLRQLAFSSHEFGGVDRLRELSILKREVPSGAADWTFGAGAKTADGPFRPPIAPEIGATMQRLCVPIRQEGVLLGFVWILEGDDPLTDPETEAVLAALDTIAIAIQRDQLAHELHKSRSRGLLRDLVATDDPRAREHAAAELIDADLFVASEPVVAVVVTLHPGEPALLDGERNVLDGWLERIGARLLDRRHVSLIRRDHGLMLVSDKDPLVSGAAKQSLLAELVGNLSRDLTGVEPVVGIGEPVDDLRDFYRSYQQAAHAARVTRLADGFGQVTSFDRLGVYGLLSRIPPEELTVHALPPGLRRLLEAGVKGEQLADTLEAFLEHAGDVQAAAEKLFIHRTTLYYRLQRIEEYTGAQLALGEDRLALHLGLKIARLIGLRHD
ncbi:PucR family transcriptional regulator [Nonomuraea guangzhouensis]|uniref:PucR family transcriptional regulator n=1 Tax=Nonomuraea guangzhouensis TaxID=1291555 RepID=A0ABW4GHE8_9ACTN|nr:helix-turn-helix domain-containing protein [Nonomuraea guangzhouensis]